MINCLLLRWRLMKLVACLLGCISLAVFGQTPAAPTQRDLDAKLTVLQRRGAEVLSREHGRSKANLCAKAGPSDLSVGECYLAEGKVTNADYTEYVRVVGALLRLPRYTKAAFPGAPRRLDIDTAETTWLTYREQSCRAMIYQWEGGTLGRVNYPKCLLTVTWDHMNELAELYSGLWQ
jgi:uncharacterized protein YecT (DUF1311 family)